jgi:peroxiredoxin
LPTATLTETPTFTLTPQYTPSKTPRPSGLIGAVVGLYAPDLSLLDVATGQRVTLSQFDGQPVLFLFWATWCPHCDSEIESIKTINQTYKDACLVVLTINAAEDPATVTAYRSIHQLTFPILLDSNSKVQSAYSVYAIPRHFFINSSGRIAFIGYGEMTLDEMKVQVDAILRLYPTSTP